MDSHDYTYRELEHLRLLDLSLLTVSVTLIYLISANWNPAPELTRELRNLRTNFSKLASPSLTPLELENLISQNVLSVGPFRNSLLSVGEAISSNFPRYKVDTIISDPELKELARFSHRPENAYEMTLANIRSYATSPEWEIEEVQQVESALFKLSPECHVAIQELTNRLEAMSTRFTVGGAYLGSITVQLERFTIVQWPSRTNDGTGKARLGTTIDLSETRYRKESDSTTHEQKFCRSDVLFKTSKTGIQSSMIKWFEGTHKNIINEWHELSNKQPTQALSWSAKLRVAGIAEQKPAFLGMSLGGSGMHVFILGLLAAQSITLYILMYSSRLRNYVLDKKYRNFLSPWIGAMEQKPSSLIAFTTLVLIPSVANFLSVWRILDISWYFAVLIAMAASSILLYNFYLARQISMKIRSSLQLTCLSDTAALVAQEMSPGSMQAMDEGTTGSG